MRSKPRTPAGLHPTYSARTPTVFKYSQTLELLNLKTKKINIIYKYSVYFFDNSKPNCSPLS